MAVVGPVSYPAFAWKIPWVDEPGRLQSMGSHRVGHPLGDHMYQGKAVRGQRGRNLALLPAYVIYLKKEMATHSSVLAWRIPGMGEPGSLQTMWLLRVGYD